MSQWLFTTTRWAIYARDGFSCAYCEVTMVELIDARDGGVLTVDHVKARSKGGNNDTANLVACCYDCNEGKGRRSLREACKELGQNYEAVRARIRRRTRRDIERFRVAAKVLLGKLEGVPVAQLVEDHDWIVKRQWGDSIDGDYWEHLQDAGVCRACGRS